MYLREIKPASALASFVRLYRIIDFHFPHNNPLPTKSYTPRPEQCLQFFQSPTQIAYGNKIIKPKNALIVGQHTVINDRTVFKKFISIQVVFQPGGLSRLLNMPAFEFTNQVIEAEDVLGNDIAIINDKLYHATSHLEMTTIVETFLLNRVKNIKSAAQSIDLVTFQMLNNDSNIALDYYASNACLSYRQFDRRFTQNAGISPKEYLRVVRFDRAYRLKNLYPGMSWFNIAIACGYYDYQHLSKDYKDFTGFTPPVFFAMDSPERLLGTEEVY